MTGSLHHPGWRGAQEISVQPPAHSRLSCELRSASSGLCPVGSWKIPRTETAQPLWMTGPTVLVGKEVFFISSLKLYCFNFCLLCLILLCPTGKSPSPSSYWLPRRWWRAAVRWSLKLSLLQAGKVPVLQLLLTGQVLQLQPSWCPLMSLFQFVTIFPILEGSQTRYSI